jgi:AraC-like DNA-binding protein
MEAPLKVAVLVGSLGESAHSRKVAQALMRFAPTSLDCRIVEIADLPPYNEDPDGAPSAAWTWFRKEVPHADAVLIAAPPRAADRPRARGGLAPWQQRKIDRYLRDHLDRAAPLDQLAELVTLSVGHFCRAFKATFGDTPHAYLVRLRLEKAQEMMLATRDPLSQIALATGFADQAHLTKTFRRGVGQTPNAWRRRNLTEAQVEATRQRPGDGQAHASLA